MKALWAAVEPVLIAYALVVLLALLCGVPLALVLSVVTPVTLVVGSCSAVVFYRADQHKDVQ